jgi:hypothetical protein
MKHEHLSLRLYELAIGTVPTRSQISSVRMFPSYFFAINFNIILPSVDIPDKFALLFRFAKQDFV